ncbi:hypothetical protein [Pseudomonas baetica]|jgi:hypothetical protein|nr:hypothetical protein [Pseudomonas baetica]MDR9866192.1 hypothetical protein [Pseudomonas baetica]
MAEITRRRTGEFLHELFSILTSVGRYRQLSTGANRVARGPILR